MIWFFLIGGLFLGWSLGANDAANVFGTAVGTRMLRFKTATIICAVFVVLGAVMDGSGTTRTINTLGTIDSGLDAFVVSIAAALTVLAMISLRIPASSSQAIVGAIIGWNLFHGNPTDLHTFSNILSGWVICPLLSGLIAIMLYYFFRKTFYLMKIHLLVRDFYIRLGLLLAGIFGAYALGANNIANVVGIFVVSSPFRDMVIFKSFTITALQQLFMLGGLAIALGILTYSRRIMFTIGQSLLKLSPEMALIAVFAQSIVLFLFSSVKIEHWLINNHLPSFPLVPLSSTQATIGAIIALGLIRNSYGIKYGILGRILAGWITTPLLAGIIAFTTFFVLKHGW